MRNRIWVVLAGLLLLAPATARAQYYEVPPTPFTAFWSHPRYEDGGFFATAEFMYLRQSNILKSQTVAIRGFLDYYGLIAGTIANPAPPGTFVGTGEEALNVEQVSGPSTYQPGLSLTMGWRFQDGLTVMANWWHITDTRRSATATIVPPNFNLGDQLQGTYLFSPVTNFPNTFAGATFNNPRDVIGGATYGIWNAASEMNIQWLQRFDMFDVMGRFPLWQSENYRCFGYGGARTYILWERFKWRTVSADQFGEATDKEVANYSNVVSNRLYGGVVGMGWEWKVAETPVGVFSMTMDYDCGLFLDFVKERVRWELGDRSAGGRRSRNEYTLVPGFKGNLGLMWYAYEGIQMHVGWNIIALFNTIGSPHPIDFNFGTIDPEFKSVNRFVDGLNLGVTIVF